MVVGVLMVVSISLLPALISFYFLRIPGLHTSYTRAGLVVDDTAENICKANRYKETADTKRLVSSTTVTGMWFIAVYSCGLQWYTMEYSRGVLSYIGYLVHKLITWLGDI